MLGCDAPGDDCTDSMLDVSVRDERSDRRQDDLLRMGGGDRVLNSTSDMYEPFHVCLLPSDDELDGVEPELSGV